MMEEESIQAIRETNRNRVFLNRRKVKDAETDVRRSIHDSQLKATDVPAIANTLKTKSSISATDLKLLQNALVDDPKNFEVLLSTHGALRGLVRELTGHDSSKQLASCGCLCNLALADSKACCTVARAAGAYLVTALHSLTVELAVTCAWTLGNLAGSGPRACDVITAQGALSRLCDVTVCGEDMAGAVMYALAHVAHSMKDELSPEYLQKIAHCVSSCDLTIDSTQLLFIISCHKDFSIQLLPEQYLNKMVENLSVSIEQHINKCRNNPNVSKDRNCCNTIYLIRVLANINNSVIYASILDRFVRNNMIVSIRKFLEVEDDKSMWWLLGNMLNCCGDSVFFQQLLS